MKLEEVLPFYRQGRRIKRKRWGAFYKKDNGHIPGFPFDILSDDWEVEPITKEITLEQLKAAWTVAFFTVKPESSFIFEQIASHLGFTVN